MPTHTAAAMRATVPPAFRTTSRISSLGGSQKSIISATGPDKYHPNHKRTKNLTTRRFIALSLAPEAALSQIHSVLKILRLSVNRPTGVLTNKLKQITEARKRPSLHREIQRELPGGASPRSSSRADTAAHGPSDQPVAPRHFHAHWTVGLLAHRATVGV